jgi:hypothetical protein
VRDIIRSQFSSFQINFAVFLFVALTCIYLNVLFLNVLLFIGFFVFSKGRDKLGFDEC